MKPLLIASFILAVPLIFIETPAANAETCFKTGERVSGLNKICYYNCPSGEATITIKSHEVCPVTIKR